MDLQVQEEGSDAQALTTPVQDPLRKLVFSSILVAVIAFWAINSFTKPGGVLHGVRIWSRPYTSDPPGAMFNHHDETFEPEILCNLHDIYENSLPATRTVFGNKATNVYGWPSTGGVWVHHDCYGVELDFLRLSRFEDSATQRFSEEEDAFCKRLEWIGARFYESEYEYNHESLESTHEEPQWWFGWPGTVPEGGVWALQTRGLEGAKLGVSRIRNALTMEERCKAIESVGGEFYETWEDMVKSEFPS